MLASEVTES